METKEKKKLLYLMGIEWSWIYQRPQIIALGLQNTFEVTVVTPRHLFSLGKQQQNKKPQHLKYLLQLPFQEKLQAIRWFSNIINKSVLCNTEQYDIIWIGYPIFQRYVPEQYQGMIVYDCMDNYVALYPDQHRSAVEYVKKMEQELISRASIIITSSNKLKDKVHKLSLNAKVTVIRNACSSSMVANQPQSGILKDKYTLGYVGTISEWLDNILIRRSLEVNENICYELIGPAKGKKVDSERVNYRGVIEHKNLSAYIEKIDCLVMPFIVCDIILYVDPVKMYEYIAWGKCIISSYYPELEHFSEFVFFYNNEEEYFELLNKLSSEGFPAKYNEIQQKNFLQDNTWDNRLLDICRIID